MAKFKQLFFRICLALLIITPIAALAHFIAFPQQTRCILIDFSNFKKEGRLYFNAAAPKSQIDSVKLLIEQATVRIQNFWGQKTANPKFIYCDNDADFKKYSNAPAAPAITQLKLGSYIVLSTEGIDLDIIAHEMSHAELYTRTGFYNWTFVIPPWFKHGLAMQNDYRDYYSEDTLKLRSNNFSNLPNIKAFKNDNEFYAGTIEQVMLNYMTAKYEFRKWYTKAKLEQLLKDLDAGKSFEDAFVQ